MCLVTDSHSMLVGWRKFFSRLLNTRGFIHVRQTETPTAEPLVSEPSAFEVEMTIEKLKRYKSLGTDKIPSELFKAGSRKIGSEFHEHFTLFGTRRNCLRSGRSRSLYLLIRWAIPQTVVIIGAYHFSQLHTKFYSTSCCQS